MGVLKWAGSSVGRVLRNAQTAGLQPTASYRFGVQAAEGSDVRIVPRPPVLQSLTRREDEHRSKRED